MKKILFLNLLCFILIGNTIAQNLDGEQSKMQNSTARNFGKFNVLGGIGTSSIEFIDRQGNELSSAFNAYNIFIGGSTYSQFSKKETSAWAMNTEYIFGRQVIEGQPSPALPADSLSIFNFTKYEGYFFRVPVKITYNQFLGEKTYWGFSFGGHLTTPMLYGNIENDHDSDELMSVYGMYLLDYGWNIGLEFGYRAGYIAFDFFDGINNMSEEDDGGKINDLGTFTLTVGYRFETDQGKEDAQKVKDLLGQ